MKLSSFAWGLGVGMVAGVVVDMVAFPLPKARKNAVDRTMQRVGSAVYSAIDDVSHIIP